MSIDLQDLFAKLKNNSVVISAIAIPVIMVLIVYWSDINVLVNEALYDESATHLMLVPVFVLYIVYTKRNDIKASITFEKFRNLTKESFLTELIGLSLCLFALLINWYGSNTFSPLEYHIFSIPILLMGITIFLFNTKTLRALIAPILFLFFLIPVPSEITYAAGGYLGNFNTQASYTLLKAVGLPVALDSSYGSPVIAVANSSDTSVLFSVDLACSGVYSLIAFVMFATFLAYIMQGSVVKKGAMFLVGLVTMQVLNIFRICSIVVAGHWFGEETAMSIVHLTAGWLLIFCGMLVILLISEKVFHLKLFRSVNKVQPCPKCEDSSKQQESFCLYCGKFFEKAKTATKSSKMFWIKTFALLVSLIIITVSLQVPAFAFAEGLTITDPDVGENVGVFPEYPDHEFKFLYRDTGYERISEQDFSLMYAYVSLNSSTPTVYIDIGVASTLSNLHNWEVCFASYQVAHGQSPLVTIIDSSDVQISENPKIVGRYFTFESPNNYAQVTFYWYETAYFNSGLSVERRYIRISLIILTDIQSSYEADEEKLLAIAQYISEDWEPLRQQNIASLSAPLQQGLLVASTCFIVVSGTVQYLGKIRRKEKNKILFERWGSSSDKQLYKTITSINEGTGATTAEIAQALERINGTAPDVDELISRLRHLQENALLDMELVIAKDNPHIVWQP